MTLRSATRRLDYKQALTVTCPNPICGKKATVTATQRNTEKFSGIWCDGSYGARHVVCPMLGPKGERWA